MNMVTVPEENSAAPIGPDYSEAVLRLEGDATPVLAPVDEDFPDPDAYYAQKEREHWESIDAQEAEAEEQEWFEQHDETHLPSEFEDAADEQALIDTATDDMLAPVLPEMLAPPTADAETPAPTKASTLAAFPFVALHLAGRDAVAALWGHYTEALQAYTVRSQDETTSEQRAGEMAAALIAFCYQEEIARLEKQIGIDSDASTNALFTEHTLHATPSLVQIVQDLSSSRSLQTDVYRAEIDQYVVDPIQPIVTAEQYLAGHYGQLQREGRCAVYQVENGVKRRVSHITRDAVTKEWYAHLKGVDAPVRLLTNEALIVELPAVETDASAPPTMAPVNARKYEPEHVALKLRSAIHGRLRLGRVDAVIFKTQRLFEVTFAHPITDSVREQLAAEFQVALNGSRQRALVEVPASWLGLPDTDVRQCVETPSVPKLPDIITRLTIPVSFHDWRDLCRQAADALEGKASAPDRQVLIARLRAASMEVVDA